VVTHPITVVAHKAHYRVISQTAIAQTPQHRANRVVDHGDLAKRLGDDFSCLLLGSDKRKGPPCLRIASQVGFD